MLTSASQVNVAIKINEKLGGINTILEKSHLQVPPTSHTRSIHSPCPSSSPSDSDMYRFGCCSVHQFLTQGRTIILGADVNHARVGSMRPSFAALVRQPSASLDSRLMT